MAELGIGTGLNLLALIALVREAGQGPIRYTGFEAFPLSASDMRAALTAFPEVADDVEALVAAWETGGPFRTPELEATFIFGDARETLPRWPGKADAWFLDGFAPARNPELWEPALLAEVARHTAPGGTAATYSAAGEVRRSLATVGFEVERRPGHGRKRHMTVARLA
jgi:tRNA U34 5-methylaminomethyl-2-thiouridine-forming methyltransferase MnmC